MIAGMMDGEKAEEDKRRQDRRRKIRGLPRGSLAKIAEGDE